MQIVRINRSAICGGIVNKYLIVSILVLMNQFSYSKNLSEIELFHRCFSLITQQPVPLKNTFVKNLMSEIKVGNLKGDQACLNVLELASLNKDGVAEGIFNSDGKTINENTFIVNSILENFHGLHSSFFNNKEHRIFDTNIDLPTNFLFDMDEPALFFSNALFSKAPIKSIFESQRRSDGTLGPVFKSIRSSLDGSNRSNLENRKANHTLMTNSTSQFIFSYLFENVSNNLVYKSVSVNDNDLVSWGYLIGIKNQDNTLKVPKLIFNPISQPADDISHINGQLIDYSLFQNMGGGILGSQEYFMKNHPLALQRLQSGSTEKKADGTLKNPMSEYNFISRSMTATMFTDFLCHELPTLTEEDVRADLEKFQKLNSPHTFQQSTSCLQCHSQIDPLANSFRNIGIYQSSHITENSDATLKALGPLISGAIRILPRANSNTFALQKAEGRLYYRNHVNQLIDVNINGDINSIEEIGQHFKNSDDFYRCVSKRYYKYFTGIDVKLTQGSDEKELTKYHRNKIYELAKNLKSSQSLTYLIKEIISSDIFRSRDFKITKSDGVK